MYHFGKVPEIDEWMMNNKNLDIKGNIFILGGKVKYFDDNNNKIVTEKKEYQFEVELRFYNNKDEKKQKYSKLLKYIHNKKVIAISISIILLAILIIAFIPKKIKFEISDFSISKETTNYEYIENSTYYKGEGIITTKDKKIGRASCRERV